MGGFLTGLAVVSGMVFLVIQMIRGGSAYMDGMLDAQSAHAHGRHREHDYYEGWRDALYNLAYDSATRRQAIRDERRAAR